MGPIGWNGDGTEKQMEFTLIEGKTVGVVHPADPRGKVKGRTMIINAYNYCVFEL